MYYKENTVTGELINAPLSCSITVSVCELSGINIGRYITTDSLFIFSRGLRVCVELLAIQQMTACLREQNKIEININIHFVRIIPFYN